MNPADWQCPRRIGFLFPHGCGRTTPIGCPDCNGGVVSDPFAQRSDRYSYNDYDTYPSASIAGLRRNRNDFTEADGEKLVRPRKPFEDDMTAS